MRSVSVSGSNRPDVAGQRLKLAGARGHVDLCSSGHSLEEDFAKRAQRLTHYRTTAGPACDGDLLFDYLLRLTRPTDSLGMAVVTLDVLDCGDQEPVAKHLAFYRRLWLRAAALRRITVLLAYDDAADAY